MTPEALELAKRIASKIWSDNYENTYGYVDEKLAMLATATPEYPYIIWGMFDYENQNKFIVAVLRQIDKPGGPDLADWTFDRLSERTEAMGALATQLGQLRMSRRSPDRENTSGSAPSNEREVSDETD